MMANLQEDALHSTKSETVTIPIKYSLEQVVAHYALAVLDAHHGNRTRTATHLGVSVRMIQRNLKRWQRLVDESS